VRKNERRNESWLPAIAFIALLVSTFLGLTNMYLEDVVSIYKSGTASNDFVRLLGATLMVWALCMLALFVNGSDHRNTRAGKCMMANSLACVVVVVTCLLVGFLCVGTHNLASSIAFGVLFLAKIYGYISAFIFWILY
jgi:hypothetical protein